MFCYILLTWLTLLVPLSTTLCGPFRWYVNLNKQQDPWVLQPLLLNFGITEYPEAQDNLKKHFKSLLTHEFTLVSCFMIKAFLDINSVGRPLFTSHYEDLSQVKILNWKGKLITFAKLVQEN